MTLAMVLLGLAAMLFLFFQLRMLWRARSRRGKATPDLGGVYGEAVASGKKVLFYFHSPTCRMCLPMQPVIDALARDYPCVYKIDTRADPELARLFGVQATPSTVLVEGGVIHDWLLGPQPEHKLRQWLNAGG